MQDTRGTARDALAVPQHWKDHVAKLGSAKQKALQGYACSHTGQNCVEASSQEQLKRHCQCVFHTPLMLVQVLQTCETDQ